MYYHQDHQGSTRLTTNANGTARGTMAYDAYGKVTENTNPWLGEPPLLGYVSQYHDQETGYIYLRARHYDPITGQFTSQDPLHASTHEPYGYANNNPTNNWDPSGLFCIAGRNPNGSCRGSGAVDTLVDAGKEVIETGQEVGTLIKEDPMNAPFSLGAYGSARALGSDCDVRGRAIECIGAPSPINGSSYTVGRVVMNSKDARMDDHLWAHELAHVNQWSSWGPAFPFVYGANYLWYGECNIIERDAGFQGGGYSDCDGLGVGPAQRYIASRPGAVLGC